jgi:rhamnogalacturonyl hydrolase YesR
LLSRRETSGVADHTVCCPPPWDPTEKGLYVDYPQDRDSGLWYEVIDQPKVAGNYLESSGTAMFVYAIAKGVNHGYLDQRFSSSALRGYIGLIRDKVGRSRNEGRRGDWDVSGDFRYTRIYVKRDGRWQAVLSQYTRISEGGAQR